MIVSPKRQDSDMGKDSGCSNPRDKLPLKYDHAFICDFVP